MLQNRNKYIRLWLFSFIATDWCTVTDIIQSKLSINVCGCFQTKGFVFSPFYGQKIGTDWVVVAFPCPSSHLLCSSRRLPRTDWEHKKPPQLKGSWQQWLRHSAHSTIWSKLLAELTPFAACKSVHRILFCLLRFPRAAKSHLSIEDDTSMQQCSIFWVCQTYYRPSSISFWMRMYYNAVAAAAAVPLFPSALQSSIAKGDYAPKSSLTCQVYCIWPLLLWWWCLFLKMQDC